MKFWRGNCNNQMRSASASSFRIVVEQQFLNEGATLQSLDRARECTMQKYSLVFLRFCVEEMSKTKFWIDSSHFNCLTHNTGLNQQVRPVSMDRLSFPERYCFLKKLIYELFELVDFMCQQLLTISKFNCLTDNTGLNQQVHPVE